MVKYLQRVPLDVSINAQNMKFSIKDFFSKCDQILCKLQTWSNLLKEILNGKLHFLCSVLTGPI